AGDAARRLSLRSESRFVHPLGVLRRKAVAALRIEMEVNLVSWVHGEERVRMDPQHRIADGDLAVISVAHEDRLFHRAFEHVLGYLRLLFDDLDVLGTDRKNRGVLCHKASRGNEGEYTLRGLEAAGTGVTAELDDLSGYEVG